MAQNAGAVKRELEREREGSVNYETRRDHATAAALNDTTSQSTAARCAHHAPPVN